MATRGLPTLPDAIDWAKSHWEGRELPHRMHEHAVEPDSILGSPRLTAEMMRYLLATPEQIMTVRETVICGHPRMDRGVCPDCVGGVKEVEVTRRRYPMWRALWRLTSCPPARAGLPKPLWIVLSLWASEWRPDVVVIRNEDGEHMDAGERDVLILRAIRSLAHEYEETAILRAMPSPQPVEVGAA